MSALPGIPEDFAIHQTVGEDVYKRDEWIVGPFRLRRVAITKGEPWLAQPHVGLHVAATGATPREAMERALAALRTYAADLDGSVAAGDDVLELLADGG